MSWEALSLVSDRRLGSSNEKHVLLVLANYADSELSTFVGQKRLAAMTQLSERTVRSILASLEERGLIIREARRRADGFRSSDRIVLVEAGIRNLPAAVAGKPGVAEDQPADDDQPAKQGGSPANDDTPHRQMTTHLTGKAVAGQEPSVEPSVEPSALESAPPQSDGDPPAEVEVVETVSEVSETSDALPARMRPRDEVFEAVAAVCYGGWEKITSVERAVANRACKELRAVGATPDDVYARAAAWVLRFGDINAIPSPMGLVKHWSSLASPVQRIPRHELDALAEEQVLEVRMAEAERRERQRLAEEAARAAEAAEVVPIRQLGPDPAVSPSVRHPRRVGESVREYVARIGRISTGVERPGDRDEEAG